MVTALASEVDSEQENKEDNTSKLTRPTKCPTKAATKLELLTSNIAIVEEHQMHQKPKILYMK